ncbi:hypothetical protein [Mycolicibacterium lutetiense]
MPVFDALLQTRGWECSERRSESTAWVYPPSAGPQAPGCSGHTITGLWVYHDDGPDDPVTEAWLMLATDCPANNPAGWFLLVDALIERLEVIEAHRYCDADPLPDFAVSSPAVRLV